MDFHMLIVIILILSLIISIAQKLLYVALIVVVLGFAYYTGIAQLLLDIIMPLILQVLPESWHPDTFIGLIGFI